MNLKKIALFAKYLMIFIMKQHKSKWKSQLLRKNKLKKFVELNTFSNVIQPNEYNLREDISLKGNWDSFFVVPRGM